MQKIFVTMWPFIAIIIAVINNILLSVDFSTCINILSVSYEATDPGAAHGLRSA